MSQFSEGDWVYHRKLQRHGRYVGRHNWGNPETSPETSSYVHFDGDEQEQPVSTYLLDRASQGEPR